MPFLGKSLVVDFIKVVLELFRKCLENFCCLTRVTFVCIFSTNDIKNQVMELKFDFRHFKCPSWLGILYDFFKSFKISKGLVLGIVSSLRVVNDF